MRFWQPEEDELLKKYWPYLFDKLDMKDLEQLLNRTEPSIRERAKRLDLESPCMKAVINQKVLEDLERRISI